VANGSLPMVLQFHFYDEIMLVGILFINIHYLLKDYCDAVVTATIRLM